MNKKQLVLILIAIIAFTSLGVLIGSYWSNPKEQWFDYNKVYNNCKLKLDLEKDLEKVVKLRTSSLDSLQLELSILSNKVQVNEASKEELSKFEDLKQRYLSLKNSFEQENIRLKEEYYSQIRSHINDNAKKYAEELEVDFLFAAVGDGSMMYATPDFEVTDEFMKFLDK